MTAGSLLPSPARGLRRLCRLFFRPPPKPPRPCPQAPSHYSRTTATARTPRLDCKERQAFLCLKQCQSSLKHCLRSQRDVAIGYPFDQPPADVDPCASTAVPCVCIALPCLSTAFPRVFTAFSCAFHCRLTVPPRVCRETTVVEPPGPPPTTDPTVHRCEQQVLRSPPALPLFHCRSLCVPLPFLVCFTAVPSVFHCGSLCFHCRCSIGAAGLRLSKGASWRVVDGQLEARTHAA